MGKSLVIFISLLSSFVAQAGEIIVAKALKSERPRLSDQAIVLLNDLAQQGKVIKREDNQNVEITYHHEDAPDLFNALKDSGFITDRISNDSQKTGGGCGDVSGAKTTGR